MKKIFNLFLALPLLFAASCSDDNDIPQVSINLETSGYWKVDNDSRLYLVEGETLYVDGLYVKSLEGKEALISQATYYLNGFGYADPLLAPYKIKIPSEVLREGNNILMAAMTLAVVDYPVSVAEARWDIVLVSSEEELPQGAVYVPASNIPDDYEGEAPENRGDDNGTDAQSETGVE